MSEESKFSLIESLTNRFYAASKFAYQTLESPIISFAFPLFFSRAVVACKGESWYRSSAIAAMVGGIGWLNNYLKDSGYVDDYRLTYATQAASYIYPQKMVLNFALNSVLSVSGGVLIAEGINQGYVSELCTLSAGASVAYIGTKVFPNHALLSASGGFVIGTVAAEPTFKYLFPVQEMQDTYNVLTNYTDKTQLDAHLERLTIVTVNIQLPIATLGINYLQKMQEKSNLLLDVGKKSTTSSTFFRNEAVKFVIACAIPYMLQRVVTENINQHQFNKFNHFVHNEFRLQKVFTENNLGLISKSNYTIDSHASALSNVVTKSYEIISRKIFSVPKLLLFPFVAINHPLLTITILPISLFIDFGKSKLVSVITDNIETLNKEIKETASQRDKIEQHDAQNSDLIFSNDATEFTQDHWRSLNTELQKAELPMSVLQETRNFFNWLYFQDVLSTGIECSIAMLLEAKSIRITEIYLYKRVIEDTIDLLLTKSRKEAELASIATDVKRLQELNQQMLQDTGNQFQCKISPDSEALEIREVEFSRGTGERKVTMKIPNLYIGAGIYAVLGANGSGKSSLFKLLSSCTEGEVDSSFSIVSMKLLSLPSSEIVVLDQRFYCPLYVKPMEWILQSKVDKYSTHELETYEKKMDYLSQELRFYAAEGKESLLKNELYDVKDDWYTTLSGGQKSKIEFIKKVFLREKCPKVLLIDETFSPLDAETKLTVQNKIKDSCQNSIVMIIHHESAGKKCIDNEGGFFDATVRIANNTGVVYLSGMCEEKAEEI